MVVGWWWGGGGGALSAEHVGEPWGLGDPIYQEKVWVVVCLYSCPGRSTTLGNAGLLMASG